MQDQADSKAIPGFTPAEALAAFSVCMLDKRAAHEWVLQRFHPEGAQCPQCKTPIQSEKTVKSFLTGGRVCCKACKKWFTYTTNTILHGSQLDFHQLYLIAVLSDFAEKSGASATRSRELIAQILDIHHDTVRDWQANFKALGAAGV